MGNTFWWKSSKNQDPGVGGVLRVLEWMGGSGCAVTPGTWAGVQGPLLWPPRPCMTCPPCLLRQPQLRALSLIRGCSCPQPPLVPEGSGLSWLCVFLHASLSLEYPASSCQQGNPWSFLRISLHCHFVLEAFAGPPYNASSR